MNIHFWDLIGRSLLRYFFVVTSLLLLSCVSKEREFAPTALVYPPTSSIRERASALQAARSKSVSPVQTTKRAHTSPSLLEGVDSQALAKLGLQYARQGTLAEAEVYFEEASRLGKLNEQELLARSYIYYEMGDLQKAYDSILLLWDVLERKRVHSFEEELKTNPMRECALLLALIQLETHERRDGIELLERLVRTNAQWLAPYLVLGNLYFQEGASELAERVAKAGLDRVAERDSADLYFLLAKAQKEQKKLDEAQRTLRLAQTHFPEDVRLLVFAGVFLYEDGNRIEGCELFEKAYSKNLNSQSATENYSVCLIQQGESEKAENVLRKSLLNFPRSHKHHLLLGMAAKKSGHFTEARSAWESYLALAPRSDENRIAIEENLNDLPSHQSDNVRVVPVAP